jgi:hypothetical protein
VGSRGGSGRDGGGTIVLQSFVKVVRMVEMRDGL